MQVTNSTIFLRRREGDFQSPERNTAVKVRHHHSPRTSALLCHLACSLSRVHGWPHCPGSVVPLTPFSLCCLSLQSASSQSLMLAATRHGFFFSFGNQLLTTFAIGLSYSRTTLLNLPYIFNKIIVLMVDKVIFTLYLALDVSPIYPQGYLRIFSN